MELLFPVSWKNIFWSDGRAMMRRTAGAYSRAGYRLDESLKIVEKARKGRSKVLLVGASQGISGHVVRR